MANRWLNYLPPFLRSHLGNPTVQRLLGNTGWLLGEKVVRAVGEFTISIWIARYLGPNHFGILNYAIAFASFFAMFARMGLDGIVVHELVKAKETERKNIFFTASALRISGSIISTLLAIISINLIESENLNYQSLITVIAIGFIFQASDISDFWFQAKTRAKNAVFVRFIVLVISYLVKILCILFEQPLKSFAIAILIESIMLAIGFYIALIQDGFQLNSLKINLKLIRHIFSQSWPLIIATTVNTTFMKIDQVMLQNMIGNDVVGTYSIAVKLSEGLYFIPVAIVNSLTPKLVELKYKESNNYLKRISQLFKLMAFIAYFIIGLIIITSDWIVSIILGEAYAESISILKIHVFAMIFVFLGVAQRPWNITEGYSNIYISKTLIGLALNVTMNFVLIPKLAGIGAAIATVFSYSFCWFFSNLFDSRTRPIFWLQLRSLLCLS